MEKNFTESIVDTHLTNCFFTSALGRVAAVQVHHARFCQLLKHCETQSCLKCDEHNKFSAKQVGEAAANS